MAVSDIYHGRQPVGPVCRQIDEYFFMQNFPSMSLNEIRSLTTRDYRIFTLISNTYNKIHNQEQERATKRATRQSSRR